VPNFFFNSFQMKQIFHFYSWHWNLWSFNNLFRIFED